MKDQQIQWVVLPAGPGGAPDRLRVSVVAAPRLRTDEGDTLAQFPDFADWPALVASATFALELAGVAEVAATRTNELDSALWQALFPPETLVIPFVFDDFADRPMVSYSHAAVTKQLRKLYATVAAQSPDSLVPVTGELSLAESEAFQPWRELAPGRPRRIQPPADARERAIDAALSDARARAALRRDLGERGGPLIEPLPGDGRITTELERLVLFHARGQHEPLPMPADGEYYRNRIDFHQMVSALGDHPWLARRLGLVIDLDVARADLPDTVQSAPRTLSLRRDALAVAAQLPFSETTPGSVFVLGDVPGVGVHFAAAARTAPDPARPDLPPSGLRPLSGVTLESADIDGGALQALHLAATVTEADAAAKSGQVPLHQPAEAGLPALRTGGLSLVEKDRAAHLQAEFSGQLAGEQGQRTWVAEDLVRGYRLDVLDEATGVWRSLHHRTSSAVVERFADGPLAAVDEGFFAISLAGAPAGPAAPPDPTSEVYVHEALVSWDGWSLSAPRAGKPLGPDPDSAPVDPVPNTPFTTMGLSLSSRIVPGTLPRLRFGRRYRVRLREVDFAGNGPTPAEADQILGSPELSLPSYASDELRYLRMEPVPPPVIVAAQRFGEGASAQRWVIRSDRDTGPDAYAEKLNAELGGSAYTGHDDRHVAAPKASFDLAEKHGMFDPVIGAGAATAEQVRAAYAVAVKESGRFDVTDAADAELMTIPAAADRPEQRYVIRHAEQLDLPYLPDPLARGVVLFGLPGLPPGDAYRLRFADDGQRAWHDARPLRLRLVAGDAAPDWDAAARVLTVSLPQAATARARIASILDDPSVMGVLDWCVAERPADVDRVIESAAQNTCPLLTPWLDLEFVHAVRRPLTDPVLEVVPDPALGQTWTDLAGQVDLHVRSTEKVDLVANWTEEIDDPGKPAPGIRRTQAQVFELAVREGAAHPDEHPSGWGATLQGDRLLTFDTAAARAGDHRTFIPPVHDFGDTKYRRVGYTAIATTPFRENFPLAWTADQPDRFTAPSNEVAVDVLSRARPAPPTVAYVLPTLGWERSDDGVDITSRRRGGGLRVWLDRPWFSSGDGELLGVVTSLASAVPVGDAAYPLVSAVGQDPIRSAADLPLARAAMFRGGLPPVRLALPELTAQTVSVVGYQPQWHGDSKRWFCDIDLDTEDAYFPFVRLALVRYQPHSLPGCHLSQVVLTDICQTLPDRTATLRRDPADPLSCEITVTGPSYAAFQGVKGVKSDAAHRGTITAQIQQADPAVLDPELRWQPANVDWPVLTQDQALDAWSPVTWRGQTTLPADGAAYRILLVEQEHLAVDSETDPGEIGSRVVYAAAFEL